MRNNFALQLTLVIVCLAAAAGLSSADFRGDVPTGNRAVISSSAHSTLQSVYKAAGPEVPTCLFGQETADGGVRIESVDFPARRASTDSTVRFDGSNCESRPTFVGYAHNHELPRARCAPSPIDSARFYLNPDSDVEVIACQTSGREVRFRSFFSD